MLKFNYLYVKDGKIYISVSVLSGSQYSNVYISRIYIDTQDTYVEGGSSDAAIVYDDETGSTRHQTTVTDSYDIQTLINANTLKGASNNALFFVTVLAGSTDDFAGLSQSECGADNTKITGTCVDLAPFYATAMSYIKDLSNKCETSCNKSYLIDYILKFKALELAISTGNYVTAIDLYKDLFNVAVTYNKKGGCNCGH